MYVDAPFLHVLCPEARAPSYLSGPPPFLVHEEGARDLMFSIECANDSPTRHTALFHLATSYAYPRSP